MSKQAIQSEVETDLKAITFTYLSTSYYSIWFASDRYD